jgi:predicted phage replisome organizer
MAKEKRFFWFKMDDDFFQKKEIKKLRTIAGGDTFVIIYLKIILLSLKNGGKLYFEGIDDCFASEIALEIDEMKDNVRITLDFLLNHSVVEKADENEFHVNDICGLIGSESSVAARMRKSRETRRKQLECNSVTQALQSGYTELELHSYSELNLNKEIQPSVPPSADPVKKKRQKPERSEDDKKIYKAILDMFYTDERSKHLFECNEEERKRIFQVQTPAVYRMIDRAKARCREGAGIQDIVCEVNSYIDAYISMIDDKTHFMFGGIFLPSVIMTDKVFPHILDRKNKECKSA